MKYNLKNIMNTAWHLFRLRSNKESFAECLHRAWLSAKQKDENARRIEEAKKASGITEEVRTWFGWFEGGYEVVHESKNLFQVVLLNGKKGDGATKKESFFGRSQVALRAA